MIDSLRVPVETATLIAEKLNSISLHFNNSLFVTIQKQQNILSDIILSTAQSSLFASKRFENISNMLIQEISFINNEMPLQLANVIKGIEAYNFQNYLALLHESVRDIITDLDTSYVISIQKILPTIDFNAINWSILDKQIGEISENEEIFLPTKQEIKEITREILEESEIFQSQENIEKQLNMLINNAEKTKQPWYKAVLISIIASFVIFLLNPLIEPFKQEYTNFIQQNSRMVIKKMQHKVHEEFGDSPLLKEYKIISTQEMRVRITNKVDSSSIGKVYFGQLVRVVQKKRNWSLVQYENESGELIEGWVFTRYLSEVTY